MIKFKNSVTHYLFVQDNNLVKYVIVLSTIYRILLRYKYLKDSISYFIRCFEKKLTLINHIL